MPRGSKDKYTDKQKRQAEQPDIGTDDGTASCLVHLAR